MSGLVASIADTSPSLEKELGDEAILALIAKAKSWLQITSDGIIEHRNLVLDPVPEGLSPLNEARRSVHLAHLVRTMRDARENVSGTLVEIRARDLRPEHALSLDAIELACCEIDAYLARLPLPPI